MRDQTVLLVDDDLESRDMLCSNLSRAGYKVEPMEDTVSAKTRVNQGDISMVIAREKQSIQSRQSLLKQLRAIEPDLPFIVMSDEATIDKAVEAMRSGASDFISRPVEPKKLLAKLKLLVSELGQPEMDVVAEDPETLAVLRVSRRVALTDTSVLLTGPSGSGKEVIARYIHDYSPRSRNDYIAVNCAAIPENLLEATLFGYEKGAFTGATESRAGKFEQAQGGTLLLDEVSEMSVALQAKLLRVLQEKEVERIGGKESIQLDVRVIATSNKNLKQAVQAGDFREDLFYRLNVFPIRMKPLRERRGDILPLAHAFIRQQSGNVYLAPEAKNRLLTHAWPGNVRELENVIQRAMILKTGGIIESKDLLFEMAEEASIKIEKTIEPVQSSGGLNADLKDQEFRMIRDTLQALGGSRKRTAETLGISPRTLRYKLARMRDAGMLIPE